MRSSLFQGFCGTYLGMVDYPEVYDHYVMWWFQQVVAVSANSQVKGQYVLCLGDQGGKAGLAVAGVLEATVRKAFGYSYRSAPKVFRVFALTDLDELTEPVRQKALVGHAQRTNGNQLLAVVDDAKVPSIFSGEWAELFWYIPGLGECDLDKLALDLPELRKEAWRLNKQGLPRGPTKSRDERESESQSDEG